MYGGTESVRLAHRKQWWSAAAKSECAHVPRVVEHHWQVVTREALLLLLLLVV
jgi:hypothetical protein